MTNQDNTQAELREKIFRHIQGSHNSASFTDLMNCEICSDLIASHTKERERLARMHELEGLEKSGYWAPDCPDDCTELDPLKPTEHHWHHVAHSVIKSRIADLEKDAA